jgi:hypothetical protein
MENIFEVSFNSPQCGWMSIGFKNAGNEFNSTTAHAPHSRALSEILQILTRLLGSEDFQEILLWNRDPEEFDFVFAKTGDEIQFEIYQYPTEERLEKELVFLHKGEISEFCREFRQTFAQLYADRNTDEFEANWRQPFPFQEFTTFEESLKSYGK